MIKYIFLIFVLRSEMKYINVKTPQGVLIYVPKEKHLYARHDTSKFKRNGKQIWTCYQKTLAKRKVYNRIYVIFISN